MGVMRKVVSIGFAERRCRTLLKEWRRDYFVNGKASGGSFVSRDVRETVETRRAFHLECGHFRIELGIPLSQTKLRCDECDGGNNYTHNFEPK